LRKRKRRTSAQGRELKRLPTLIVSLTFLFTALNVFLALAFKEIGAVGWMWTWSLDRQLTILIPQELPKGKDRDDI
jgi:hypothetical protein